MSTSRRKHLPIMSLGVEYEEHYVCHGVVFYEIRGRYHCLFKQCISPLSKVMEYEVQLYLRIFSIVLKRHREKLLNDNNTTTQLHKLINKEQLQLFLSRMRSKPGHCKGGHNRLCNDNFSCTYTLSSWTMIAPPLSKPLSPTIVGASLV